jgi:hypothetical protein
MIAAEVGTGRTLIPSKQMRLAEVHRAEGHNTLETFFSNQWALIKCCLFDLGIAISCLESPIKEMSILVKCQPFHRKQWGEATDQKVQVACAALSLSCPMMVVPGFQAGFQCTKLRIRRPIPSSENVGAHHYEFPSSISFTWVYIFQILIIIFNASIRWPR